MIGEDGARNAHGVAVHVCCNQASTASGFVTEHDADEDRGHADATEDGNWALAFKRFVRGVGGVHTDQHEHEEEHHEDGARVYHDPSRPP